MRYNVAQLLRQPTGATRHYQLDEPSGIKDPALDLVGPIRGTVHLLRTQRGVLVTTELRQAVRQECARCLEGVQSELTIRIEEEFLPTLDLKTGVRIDWSEDEDTQDAPLIDEKHVLDLTESVRQELLVDLPMHVLCRLDCQGICPDCGADLNRESCQCGVEACDPRWAALGALRVALEAEAED